MGRRVLSAAGVAAAIMQSPADSFLGTSMRYPFVPSWCKGSSTTPSRSSCGSGRCSTANSSRSTRKGTCTSSRCGDQASQAKAASSLPWGWRHPAEWHMVCGVRGGHASELGGAGGAGDPGMESGFDTDALALGSRGNSDGGSGSEASGDKSTTTRPRSTTLPEMRSLGFPPMQLPSTPGDGKASEASKLGRAGFSIFRCNAYQCEREVVDSGEISASYASSTQVMMRWNEPPRRALVLLKPDQELLPIAAETIAFLQQGMDLTVMVEVAAAEAVGEALDELTGRSDARRELEVFTPPDRSRKAQMGPKGGKGPSPPSSEDDGERVDFVLTLGGDGLLMYSNTLFRRSVPPHLCFNLGSMGFLAPFDYERMKEEIRHIVTGGVRVSLRMRLSARIIRDDHTSEAFHALNEIVIDRVRHSAYLSTGSSPYLTNLECYCDEQHLTTVQADGLIIATPTGSTAYSMSAGGSMVHPCVPAILFTPICPHSLSFRPIVFPDTVVLRLSMPMEARSEASVSFDGKLSQPLRRGDKLVVKTSNFPVPTICKFDSTADWFTSLDQALGFNTRMRQRAFDPPSMDSVRVRNDDRFDD
ncbi:unnamed protein product [Ascophyllum nodosum]